MVFDPEEHERNRKQILREILSAVEEELARSPGSEATCIGLSEEQLAEKTNLERGYVDRLCDELFQDGLLQIQGGLGGTKGRDWSLTILGLRAAEQHRYEKSGLAKRRKIKKWGIESVKTLSKSIWTNVLSAGGGIIGGWLLGYHWTRILRWFGL